MAFAPNDTFWLIIDKTASAMADRAIGEAGGKMPYKALRDLLFDRLKFYPEQCMTGGEVNQLFEDFPSLSSRAGVYPLKDEQVCLRSS